MFFNQLISYFDETVTTLPFALESKLLLVEVAQ